MATYSRRALAQGFLSLRDRHGHTRATRALAAALIVHKKVREADFVIRELRRELFLTKQELHVRVVSARELSADLKRSLEKLLKQRSRAASVHADYALVPALTGGFVVDSPTETVDASVQRQIATLKHLG